MAVSVVSLPVAPLDPTTDTEEAAALAGCQQGDRAAFEFLVRRYMRPAAAFALGFTGDREAALDLSQDAFIRAYRAIGRFDVHRPFYPWFHKILRNVCLTHVARAAKSHEVPLEDRLDGTEALGHASVGLDPQAALERRELRRAVWDALRCLPPADREILVLREFQESTYAEIASALDVPPGTVMSRLHSARRRLREQLELQMPTETGRRSGRATEVPRRGGDD
jgi:RNA polymerase sigma-70 factor (ECF subfamily)